MSITERNLTNNQKDVLDGKEEVGEDEGDDGHELHEDVERRAGGILERIAHGVTHDGGLVQVGALATYNHGHKDDHIINQYNE